ncbi:MAG: polyphenol oxidase family protein [Nocardioidaceae bacterium]
MAFTDRSGGVSTGPFASLNLALTGDDDPGAVAENLDRVLARFNPGGALADMHQVHGNEVVLVDQPGQRPHCDALATARPEVTLLARAADCVPVLIGDPERGLAAAVHSGRPGLEAGVVPAAVERLRELGAERLVAWVGPHICGGCYEVPSRLQEQVAAVCPEARAKTTWGTPSLDIGHGVIAQLEQRQVEIRYVGECTREHDDLYSHRRDGARAGRQAGLIKVRS